MIMTNPITIFITELNDKSESLISSVNSQVRQIIEFKTAKPTQIDKEPTSPSDSLGTKVAIAAGVVGGFVGYKLSDEGSLWSGLFGAFMASSIALYAFNRVQLKQDFEQPLDPAIDYSSPSFSLRKDVRVMHSKIGDDWEEFVMAQRNKLFDAIAKINVEVGERNKMIDLATKISVFQISLSDVNKGFNDIEKYNPTEDAFKTYVLSLEKKYVDELKRITTEQRDVYREIEDIVSKKY